MPYKLTIGLEVHAELNTKTKMFCNSANHPDEKKPNSNVCPVCMGYPGTLPVINKEAIRSILRLGGAVGGELADFAEFDRKNYFYPDIPKGYQISQYKRPLVKGGVLNGVQLTRVHLEEDAAKSSHEGGDYSLVDFNRAGVPLMELVTEPVMHTAEEAMRFAKELQLLLQYLNISDANMEKGEMRVEANISVSRAPLDMLGTKVEVKNINSFRAVGKAIEYEFKRQTELLEKGEKVVQETRGWDEDIRADGNIRGIFPQSGETFSQRLKESAHDYRYFPEPDLPKLFINEVPDLARTVLAKSLPELPWKKRERLLKLGITAEHAEIYVTQSEWGRVFNEVIKVLESTKHNKQNTNKAQNTEHKAQIDKIKLASNYITNELKKPVEPKELVEVVNMIEAGEISSKGAKGVLRVLEERGGRAREIAERENLMQESDPDILNKWIDDVLSDHKEVPIDFLIGEVMKKSKGRANPVADLLFL